MKNFIIIIALIIGLMTSDARAEENKHGAEASLALPGFIGISYQYRFNDDWQINVPITSIHFTGAPDNVSDFNTRNTGAIIKKMFSEKNYLMVGAYKNSFYKKCEVIEQCDELSYVLGTGYAWRKNESGNARISIETALVSGYETVSFLNLSEGITMFVGLSVSYSAF